MASEAVPIPFILVVIFAIVLILLGFLQYASQNAQAFSWENLIRFVPQFTSPVSEATEAEQALTVLDMLGVGPDDNMPTTSGLVACSLAKTIRDDFVEKGETEIGRGEPLNHYGDNEKLYLASAKFKIDFDEQTGIYRTDGQVGIAKMLEVWKKTGCADLKDINNELIVPRTTCPEHFDEACINPFLAALARNLPESNKPFCTGGQAEIEVGGKRFSFGNKKCDPSDPNYVENFCSKCSSGDDNRIRTLFYSGFESKYDGSYKIDGTTLSQVYATDDSALGWTFPPNCGTQKCSPTYRWILYWNKGLKQYEFEIRKIPEPLELGRKDLRKTIDAIAFVFAGGGNGAMTGSKELLLLAPPDNQKFRSIADRNSSAGPKFPDMREKIDFTFISEAEMDLNDFVEGLQNSVSRPGGISKDVIYYRGKYRIDITKLPQSVVSRDWGLASAILPLKANVRSGAEMWNFEKEDCNGDDCFASESSETLEKVEYDVAVKFPEDNIKTLSAANYLKEGQYKEMLNLIPNYAYDGIADNSKGFYLNTGDICKTKNEELFRIKLKHNLRATNNKFLPNHKYHVIVNRFLLGPQLAKGEGPQCAGGNTFGCAVCWEPAHLDSQISETKAEIKKNEPYDSQAEKDELKKKVGSGGLFLPLFERSCTSLVTQAPDHCEDVRGIAFETSNLGGGSGALKLTFSVWKDYSIIIVDEGEIGVRIDEEAQEQPVSPSPSGTFPDLTATVAIEGGGTPDKIVVKLRVANQGGMPTNEGRMQYTINKAGTDEEVFMSGLIVMKPIESGSVLRVRDVPYYSHAAGNYYIKLKLDTRQETEESNEGNNEIIKYYTIVL